MSTRYLVGVDVGTTATKAVLVSEDGGVLAESAATAPLIRHGPDHVEQDPEEILRTVTDTVAHCMQQARVAPADVAGIALDGQMAGIMLIDRDWNPVTPYDSWLDTRCSPYVREMREHAVRITELTGGPPTYSHGPKLLWWMRERPDVFARASRLVMPAAFVAGKLAGLKGEDAFIDVTYVHFSCLADARQASWSPELCRLFGVPEEVLPRIVEPWEVVGYLTPSMAERMGLRAGIPVVAGAGDQAAAMLGAGVVRPGWCTMPRGPRRYWPRAPPSSSPTRNTWRC